MKIGPVNFGTWSWWKFTWYMRHNDGICGLFMNRPDVNPGRWGFWFLGFEFGSRNPGNKFGIFLKNIGLWPF